MKAIKVNADYESVLTDPGKEFPQVNEAIEFLAFWVQDKKIFTPKKYSSDYFDYIEFIRGIRPQTTKEGSYQNWWGKLEHLELEKKLNSKFLSARLNQEEKWDTDTHIISSINELPLLTKTYLVKNDLGMSGKGFSLLEKGREKDFEKNLTKGKVIIEPLLGREDDFSFYVFPNGEKIAYENFVDQRYQYRGTLFTDYTKPLVDSFRFYEKISFEEWEKYLRAIERVITFYRDEGATSGFSIDSFSYEEKRIKFLSEVNYRRTMGLTAFELALKLGGRRKWGFFLMVKNLGEDFSSLREKLRPIEWTENGEKGVVILSPGDTRYDMFYLSAINGGDGRKLLKELELLLHTEFSVLI